MRGGACDASPAFALLAILTLAIGIGTTTAVFTVVNGVLLRPLPYRDPSRLVMLFYGHQGRVSPWFSPLNVRDYVGPSGAFAGAASVAPITVSMTGNGGVRDLRARATGGWRRSKRGPQGRVGHPRYRACAVAWAALPLDGAQGAQIRSRWSKHPPSPLPMVKW